MSYSASRAENVLVCFSWRLKAIRELFNFLLPKNLRTSMTEDILLPIRESLSHIWFPRRDPIICCDYKIRYHLNLLVNNRVQTIDIVVKVEEREEGEFPIQSKGLCVCWHFPPMGCFLSVSNWAQVNFVQIWLKTRSPFIANGVFSRLMGFRRTMSIRSLMPSTR